MPNIGRLVPPPRPGSVMRRAQDLWAAANVWLYRRSRGRVGGRMGRAPVLLLHHVGRRSGAERVTPLLFLPDGERLVVVASNGGAPKHPAWLHNVRANPLTAVEVGAGRFEVRAREADDAERARYWPRLVSIYPSYERYRERTDRRQPVVILEPVGSNDAPRTA